MFITTFAWFIRPTVWIKLSWLLVHSRPIG